MRMLRNTEAWSLLLNGSDCGIKRDASQFRYHWIVAMIMVSHCALFVIIASYMHSVGTGIVQGMFTLLLSQWEL